MAPASWSCTSGRIAASDATTFTTSAPRRTTSRVAAAVPPATQITTGCGGGVSGKTSVPEIVTSPFVNVSGPPTVSVVVRVSSPLPLSPSLI